MKKSHYFISFEGIEGVGKSTAIKFFTAQLRMRQIDFVQNREPGGTPIAEEIRQVLLSDHADPMCLETELLLMLACRAQNVMQVIRPALQKGQWVISDRFTDASYAYQGYGRGISLERVSELVHWALGDLQPDITFLLDAPAYIGIARLKNRSSKDRIESERLEFFERVRQGYLQLAAAAPERFHIISADQPLADVQQQLLNALNRLVQS